MMEYKQLWCLFVFVLCLIPQSSSDMLTGYGNNLFGSRCSYFWRFQNKTISRNELLTVTDTKGQTCKAVQLNYVSRHGARYPEPADYQYIDKFNKKIYLGEMRDKIVANSHNISPFEFLRSWKIYPASIEGLLNDLGRWESHYLANYYGKGLYNLFHHIISNTTVQLTTSNKQRAIETATEFYKALTKAVTGVEQSDNSPNINNTIIRYVKNCPNYNIAVKKNTTHLMKQYGFRKSSYFRQVVKDVTKRLELDTPLNDEDIIMIFSLCATDLAGRNSSDWCTVLTDSEREIVNYEIDTEKYYSLLYGHPLIPKLSCPLWVDIFDSFDKAIKQNDKHQTYVRGNLRFGHTDTMEPFYASLGLFHDVPGLRADNFPEMKNRMFYGSKVTTFVAHVAFILYNCGGTGPQNYLLKMMVNGEPTIIPGCATELCPYLDVKSNYNYYIEHCNWIDLCTNTKPIIG